MDLSVFFSPQVLLYMVTGIALILYAVLGGADFGAGVWQFNLAFRMNVEERRFCDRAMGPIWETNHVWLIFVLVLLFSAFPSVFAAMSRALWVPFSLALVGIVFRGCGFVFRHYAHGDAEVQKVWGVVFALSSTLTPFFLGASAGAVASGNLEINGNGQFHGDYLVGWISFLSIYTGFFSVGVCAYLAAVFLTRDANREGNQELVETWRKRSLLMGLVVGGLAFGGLLVVAMDAPLLWDSLLGKGLIPILLSVVTGGLSILFLQRRRFGLATLSSAFTVTSVIGGWAVGQYPDIIPPNITVFGAAAPESVLWVFLVTAALGALVLVPSLMFLFWVFKSDNSKVVANNRDED